MTKYQPPIGPTMRQLILCRHARSESNEGLATQDPAAIELVEEGHRQAEAFAQNWALPPPDRIIVSPFVRTQQTAGPLHRRYGMPQEIWPELREYTYLHFGSPTTPDQRRPIVERFWREADPLRCDPGAESFEGFWSRVAAFGRRAAEGSDSLLLVFTHGLFIAAFQHQCAHRRDTVVDSALMRQFDQLRRSPIGNAVATAYVLTEAGWSASPAAGKAEYPLPSARSGR